MKNYKIVVQFDGSRYKGWQKLKDNDLTIQAKIESVLSKMSEEEIQLIGCGRIDAGVHAENYVANFHTNCEYTTNQMLYYLYEYLPDDIVVKSVTKVAERFHAGYNAKSKTYVYSVNTYRFRNVFNRKYTFHSKEKLDVKLMKEAAECLIGTFDFQSFTTLKPGSKSTVRTINSLDIIKFDEKIEIVINADDFLLHMARIIVQTLLEVGKGKMKVSDVQQLLLAKKRAVDGVIAQPKGLCLRDVQYKDDKI